MRSISRAKTNIRSKRRSKRDSILDCRGIGSERNDDSFATSRTSSVVYKYRYFHPSTYLASFAKWSWEKLPSAFIQVVSRNIRLSLFSSQALIPKKSSTKVYLSMKAKGTQANRSCEWKPDRNRMYYTLIHAV